jgi:hypothetical protein
MKTPYKFIQFNLNNYIKKRDPYYKMAAQQLKINSGENQVLEDDDLPNYFIVRSIFHDSRLENLTIGIALCPKKDMLLETFKDMLNAQAGPSLTYGPLVQAEEFFKSNAWFTIVRTSPPDGITCVGDIQGSIDPTEEDFELPEGIDPARLGELTMAVNWVEAHVPRQKIGTALMMLMAKTAKDRNVYVIELDDDSDLSRFYTNLSFKYLDPDCPEMRGIAGDVWDRARQRVLYRKEPPTDVEDLIFVTKWIRGEDGRLKSVWTGWRDKHERWHRGTDGRLERNDDGVPVDRRVKAGPGLRF